jgi:signal transduction histidine kinase
LVTRALRLDALRSFRPAGRGTLLAEIDRQRLLLKATIDQFPVGVVIHDTSGDLVVYNAKSEAILAKPFKAVTPVELPSYYKAWHLDGRRLEWHEYPGVRGLRGEQTREELIVERDSGERAVILTSGAPVRDRAGRIVASVVGFVDVTEKKEVERERERLLGQTREAVRARDEVLGVVSHDLRNPLATVVMGAELLRADLGMSRERTSVLAQRIERAAKRMDRIISDLVDVSRIEAGSLLIDRKPQNAESILTELQETFAEGAHERKVFLRVDASGLDGTVACDRGRILQVLSNLVQNALKFAPPSEGHVDVGGSLTDTHATFFVRDDGPGIGADELPHVFDRYWQATRGKEKGGLGLGLAIAKGIVEAHGGRISAESTPGRGATFWVSLPRESPPAPEKTPEKK